MMAWIQPLVVLGVSALVWGLLTQRSEFGARTTLAASRHQRCLEHTAELECDLAMCKHAVDGEHPKLVWNSQGRKFWKLESGVLWEVGTPCPIQESAPTADAS